MTTRPDPAVLVVFPWCLDRIGHGNMQRVLALAGFLSRHGVAVDLIYQGNPRVPSREHEFSGFRRVTRVASWESSDDARLRSAWDAFYAGYEPPSWNLCPGTALTGVVRGLLDAVDYTAVISSYAWTAPMFEGLARRALRIVDLHDILSIHAARCGETTGTVAPFSMTMQTEQFLWRQWDVLLAITPEEAGVIAPVLSPSQRLLTVPHGVVPAAPREPVADTVVYVGSDNHSNHAAVSWLLTDVWPHVLAARPHATLRVVGLVCGPLRNTPLAATPHVEWVGFVERPAAELASAAVCVAPYLYGSGLKIKVVEAAGAGRPIVTTTAGAEGSGFVNGTHALIEDDAGAFAGAIVRLLDDHDLQRRLASSARDHVQGAFSEQACYGALLDLLRAQAPHTSDPAIVPSMVEDRLRAAVNAVAAPSVVVWGNGSHTRALVPLLGRLDVPIRCIVDNDADTERISPEQCRVVPGRAYAPARGDLIVLSSQMYESDMWNGLADVRAGGTHVIALYRRDLTTVVLETRPAAGR